MVTDPTLDALETLYEIAREIAEIIDGQTYVERTSKMGTLLPDNMLPPIILAYGEYTRLCDALHKAAILLPSHPEDK